MEIAISHPLLQCCSSPSTAIWRSASSFIPNEMMTFYVTPLLHTCEQLENSSLKVRERQHFPFCNHSCLVCSTWVFFFFFEHLKTVCVTTAGCLWLMVLSSALPAAVLTGCGVHRDSNKGGGCNFMSPRCPFPLCFPRERWAKPDSSDIVLLFRRKIIGSQHELSTDVSFGGKTPYFLRQRNVMSTEISLLFQHVNSLTSDVFVRSL